MVLKWCEKRRRNGLRGGDSSTIVLLFVHFGEGRKTCGPYVYERTGMLTAKSKYTEQKVCTHLSVFFVHVSHWNAPHPCLLAICTHFLFLASLFCDMHVHFSARQKYAIMFRGVFFLCFAPCVICMFSLSAPSILS